MKVRAERQTAARESAFFLLPGLALLCFGGAPLLGWLCVGYLLVWLGDLFRAPVFAGAAAAALHAAAVAVLWRRCYALHHAKRCVYIQSSLESSLALLSTTPAVLLSFSSALSSALSALPLFCSSVLLLSLSLSLSLLCVYENVCVCT